MTNVLLITPLNVPFKDIDPSIEIKRKLAPKYPVGLLNIGGYIEKYSRGSKAWILDYNTEAPRYFTAPWQEYTLLGLLATGLNTIPCDIDIIGISALFESNYFDMPAITNYFRARFPTALIVIGGHLASSCYREFLDKCPELNAVCFGEGEAPMLQLAKAIEGGRGPAWDVLEEEPWWATRKKIKNELFYPSYWFIEMDKIPPYNLTMVRYPDDYLNTNDDLFALGTEASGKDIYMFATRGCPYHCIFCASQSVHGHKVRSYSSARIKHDILKYHFEYGMTSFPFLDDHFLADKGKALDILNFIEKNKFTCRIFNLNYLHVDREIIQALKRTGSDRILITLDGLDEKFLRKVVKKPANFGKAKEVIGICREEGIVVICNIIVGYPGETSESINWGARKMRNMGANWYSILTASPLHGSELYDIAKKNGYLPPGDEFLQTDYYTPVITTPEFTPEWIKKKAYEINLDLNFCFNYDMRHGEYDIPLKLFRRILETIEPEHAFARYFSAICMREMGHGFSYRMYKEQADILFARIPEWAEWAEWFGLKEI